MFDALGWAKRGPTGIIGTNIVDAKATAAAIAADFAAGAIPDLTADKAGLQGLLAALPANKRAQVQEEV